MSTPTAESTEEQGQPTQFLNLETWFEEWFRSVFRRQLSQDLMWCPKWWEHEEALLSMLYLWQTWEVTILGGPEDMLNWMDRAYLTLDRLTDGQRGPFVQCSPTAHKEWADLRLPHISPE